MEKQKVGDLGKLGEVGEVEKIGLAGAMHLRDSSQLASIDLLNYRSTVYVINLVVVEPRPFLDSLERDMEYSKPCTYIL